MSRLNPVLIILIGFVLLLTGTVIPYLMLPSVNLIKSSFPMNFLSYTAQVSGLFLGIIGTAMYVRLKKK
jgi:hypothetical protein